jgi:LysR family transcriptional regulator, glycine cleavage system transcriptional activator
MGLSMRLPSLNALRAFEAAARHRSFVRAAEELHVTQGAVSRHVKLLEAELGVTLFKRNPHGVDLTTQGKSLLPELTASFERIARAARLVRESDHELRVASAPTLAGRWLVPRLSRFLEVQPGARVTLGHMCSYDDFFRGEFDVGITDYERARHQPEGLVSVLLRREALAPVCSPALLDKSRTLRGSADLESRMLLHAHPDRLDWRKWLRAAGLPPEMANGGQVFESLEMATSAARGGLGIAILDLRLIRDELASGRLVAPFDLVVSDETGYFVFAKEGRFAEPKIATFLDWLRTEVADDETSGPLMERSSPRAA